MYKGTQRKKLLTAAFVEWKLLKVPLITFISTLKKMPKEILLDRGLSTGCSTRGAAHCSFLRAF